MKRKSKWVSMAVAVCLLLPLSVLNGCPPSRPNALEQIALRPGNGGFVNQMFGEERQVVLASGNLSEAPAADEQERLDVLAEFLQSYSEFFGLPAAKAVDLAVLATAPEQPLVLGENEVHHILTVHQEYAGAIVLDGEVCGEYVRAGDRNWQLRRVQGRLFDPASLVAPVPSNDDTLGAALGLFEAYLAENELFEGSMGVLTTPVILGNAGISGFLGHYTRRYEDGTMDRLSAVVNPLTSQLQVIYHIPACQAHKMPGDLS
jgi:hypothetical protein